MQRKQLVFAWNRFKMFWTMTAFTQWCESCDTFGMTTCGSGRKRSLGQRLGAIAGCFDSQRLRLWPLKKYLLVLHKRRVVVSTYHGELFNLTFFSTATKAFSLSWKITGDRLRACLLLPLGCPVALNSRTHSHPPSGVNSHTKPWSLDAICFIERTVLFKLLRDIAPVLHAKTYI